jgi:hypothetical protein
MKLMRLNMLAFVAILTGASVASAQVTMIPLATWGGGDGWLAPGEGGYAFLGTANNERGLAFGNGHVYLVSRTGATNVRILDATAGTVAGADLGGLNVTGITGGTFVVNAAGVGADGAIYVGNLTTQSTTSPFKVYKWATEASVPTVAYTGDGNLPGSRVGDSLAAFGSGASTRLAAGYGSAPAVPGNNSYAIVDPTLGTATAVALPTPPNAGDFRLGITFSDATHVIGDQGSSIYRYTSFAGATGTLIASPAIPDPAGASADRLLAVAPATIGGIHVMAVQSVGDSHVSIYNVDDPSAPVFLASANATSGTLTANGNGTGQIAWNIINPNTAILYAMSTNQGIQAFTVSITPVPEPTSLGLVGVAGLGLLVRRLRRRPV